ncbi:hypothetical protein V7968_32620 [Nocardia vulneris]|uniref:hypothetical protein n=1 Tax=Nocardia vulneris TaxID=1141657 RepID=UPI0030D2AA9D
MTFTSFGALVFGAVIGYLTYRTLARTVDKAAVSDLAAIIGAIGGAAVTKLYEPGSVGFAWYAVGLAVGMVVFFVVFGLLNGKAALSAMMGSADVGAAPHEQSSHGPQA